MSRVPPALVALLICAGAFICLSSQSLPPMVASHFDAAGQVNGHMPRGAYIAILMLITLGIPLFVVLVSSRALSAPNARINLPNRDYWLAPERRAETIGFLSRQMATLTAMLVVFLCYVQWLVVRANARTPPALDSRSLKAGLAVLLVCILIWTLRLVQRFRRKA